MKIITCSLCALFLAASSAVVWADPPAKISAERIGIDVELIGASGLPLGTEFSLEGMIVVEKASHHKEGDSRFILIRRINGELLKTPKRIGLWEDSDLKEGEWTKMMAIEHAFYYLAFTPNQSADDMGEEKGRQTMNTGLRVIKAEDGADKSATAVESKPKGKEKPKPKPKPQSEGRSQ